MLYFLLIPNTYYPNQKLSVLSLIFIVTYLIPLLILILFKRLNIIKSYQTESIKDRKLPVALMVFLFYLLGNTMKNTSNLVDLSLLFYATSMGLFLVYILFYLKIKTSLHLLSLGISAGFFMVLSSNYSLSYIILIIFIILMAGILASSRLYLKAHSKKEVYIGFFLGIAAPLIVNFIL